VPYQAGRVALWAYLLIAFVVLPVFVPLAVLMLEPTFRLRRRMVPFVAVGGTVSTILLVAMLRGPVNAARHPWHLSYRIALHHADAMVGLYIVAICGALLFSGYRHIVIFGLGNLAIVLILADLTANGFASLWCVYAAISAGAIALHMRYARPHRADPYVLT
jgi:hypothetical protein